MEELNIPNLDKALIEPERLVDPPSWIGHIPFAIWVIYLLKPKLFVELGTYTGNSYSAFCQSIKENHLNTKSFAIDSWKGDCHSGEYGEEVYEEYKNYHNQRYSSFSELLRMQFDEGVNLFQNNSIDLLHIDGLHTYEAVKHDFKTWLPKLSNRAVVLFHDTSVYEKDFGVYQFWKELLKDYPGFELTCFNGLGVLLVGKERHPILVGLCDLNSFNTANLFFQRMGYSCELKFFLSQKDTDLKKEEYNSNESLISLIKIEESQKRKLEFELKKRKGKIEELENTIINKNNQITELNKSKFIKLEKRLIKLINKIKNKIIPFEIAWSSLFDKKWYLEQNPDVALNKENPILHYIYFGAQEERDPHPNFNTKWYLENNPDVAQSALNPLYHYIKFGEKEGRATNPFSQQSKINGISKIKYIIESLISLKNKVELRITALFSHFCYWYTEKNPKVSIIILNYNNALFTLHCLKNIWKYTQGYYYEIIVVDNGSQLKDFETLSFFKGKCKLLRLEVNRYFGEGNNLGAELANGEFIVFMNNDVTVTKNWLPPLMKAFDNHSNCGVVGPKFVYPDGLLQEAGAFIQEDGTSLQIGKHEDPKTPKFNYEREVDYISAATILLRKEIFEQVLGFDFIYEPAYYEDVDLCLKISELGLKTYYIPQSCVVHHEHATAANPKNSLLLNNIVAINREKFVIRWKKYLKTREHNIKSYSKQLISYKEVKNKKKLTAAIFTPYNIIPGGGERYLLSIAEVLIGKGYEVWLVTPEKFSRLRIIKVADILGLNISSIKTTTYREAQKMPLFDLFIAMNNEVVPPVHAIGKKNFYCCQFPFPSPNKSIRERSAWLVDYQAIIVYSNFVKKHLWSLVQLYKLGEPKIHVMPPPVNMVSSSSSRLRKCIISVGRFFTGGHCKQQDFLINSFRKIYLSDSEIELHLVGSLHVETEHREYFLKCQKLAEGLPVYFHQDASSDILERLYATSSVYWHAAGFGVDETKEPEKCEHFGISVVEAMSAGIIPIVFSNGGPAEIIKSNYNGFHYDSEEALIKITQEIFTKPENELLEIRKQARIRANDFNKNAFKKLLIELIKIT